jgi:hypothetical protein
MGAIVIEDIPDPEGRGGTQSIRKNFLASWKNWKKIRNQFQTFNVLDYGAKGDGVTDDAAAIGRAITAAGTSGTVFFPPGTYKVSSNITFPCAVEMMWGAKLSIDSGKVVTFNSAFEKPKDRAFSGSGTVAGLQDVYAEWFGPFTTATERTAALTLALAACERVYVSGFIYDPLVSSVAGRIMIMEAGVTFKVPNGAITSAPGTPALKITASTTIAGDFTCDGNVTNQSVGGFTSSTRTGTLDILSDDVRIEGLVTVNNAFWVGIHMEGGQNTGQEIENVYIQSARVYNSYYYGFMPWTVNGWRFDDLDVVLGPNSTDTRVRTGTQTITGECLNGHIKSLRTTQSLVIEKRSRGLRIDKYVGGTCKIEDAADINFGSMEITSGQFFDNNSSRIAIGALTITDSDVGGSGESAIKINTSEVAAAGDPYTGGGLHIGAVTIRDTISATNQVEVRRVVGLHIGSIVCTNPAAGVKGILFDFDAGYGTQENIFIGSIFAQGHDTYDVNVQNGFDNVHICNVNFSAVRSTNYGGPTVVGNGGWYLDTLAVTGLVNYKSEIEFGDTAVSAATLKTGTRDALPTNAASSWVYSTITSSGSYPFNAFGHLVLQPRSSSPRDIAFLTCISPATTPTLAMALEEAAGASRIAFYRSLFLNEGNNFAFGTATGSQLGTAANQKIALWGKTPIVQPSGAAQAAVTLGNTDNEIGGLTLSAAYSQAEVQALRDKCEELADDVRALSALIHAIRTAGVDVGWMKGAA